MKKLLVSSILLISLSGLKAQTGSESSGGQHLADAPALEDSSSIVEPDPIRDKMCFDKIIKVKTSTSSGPATVCVYVNTKIGLVAYSSTKPGTLELCGIKQELPDFSLSVNSLKGGSFNYFNRMKKNTVEHWMISGNNTQTEFESVINSTLVLKRKTDTKTYCDGKVVAVAYRADGRPETWYLYGKTFPDKLIMQPRKYMGNYAVGFQYTDRGTYIIMEFESTRMGSKIVEMKDTETCFDPSGYSRFVEQQANKSISTIQRRKERLIEELRTVGRQDHCQSELTTSIQFRLEMLDHEEQSSRERLQESSQASTRQGSGRAQRSTQNPANQEVQTPYGGINHDDLAQASINESRLNICQTEYQLSRSQGGDRLDQQNRERLQTRLACLQQTLNRQIEIQTEYQRINREQNNSSQRYLLKMKRMMDLLPKCNMD
jgi:hypothetical protein